MQHKYKWLSPLLVVGLMWTASAAQAATKHWKNPVSGRWDVGTNWVEGTPPVNTDDVEITVDGTYTVNYIPYQSNTDFNSLTLGSNASSGTQSLSKTSFNLNVASASTIATSGVLSQTSGIIGGAGALTVDGLLNFSGGTINGGALTIDAGATFNLAGTNKALGRNTTNTGFANYTAGGLVLTPGLTFDNNGGFNVSASAVISRSAAGANPVITNNGSFGKSGGTTTLTNVNFVNTSTVNLQGGTLAESVTGTYTQSGGSTNLGGGNLSSGTTISETGGSITGSGTITGPLNNSGGDVAPSNSGLLLASPAGSGRSVRGGFGGGFNIGTINLTGAYTQGPTASYSVDLAGTTPGTGYDRFNVSGKAALAGTLNINIVAPFDPASGDTFQILNYGSLTGMFTTVNHTGFPAGQILTTQYNPTNLTLVASDLTATITTPADGAYVNAPAKIRGTFSSVNDPIQSVTVTIYDATTQMYFDGSTFTTNFARTPATFDQATGTFAANGPGTNQVTDGDLIAITAVVTDTAGNSVNSPTINVRIDKTRPTVTSDNAPANSSTISALPGSLTGTAQDPLGAGGTASGLQSVRYVLQNQADKTYYNGTNFQVPFTQVSDNSVQEGPPGTGAVKTYSLPAPTNLPDGQYVLVIASYDNAGNNSGGGSITRSFTIDTTAPSSVTFTQLGDCSTPDSGGPVTTLMPIKGTATDSGSGIASVMLQIQRGSDGFYYNGTTFQAASFSLSTGLSTPSNGVTPFARNSGLPTASQLTAGTYTVSAIATDRAGLTTTKSVTETVGTIVNTGPSVTFTQVGDSPSPDSNSTVTTLTPIKGDAYVGGSELDRVGLVIIRDSDSYYYNGTDFQQAPITLTTTLSNSDGTLSFARDSGLPTASQLMAGTYRVRAIARNVAGQQTVKTVTETVAAKSPVRRSAPSAGNS